MSTAYADSETVPSSKTSRGSGDGNHAGAQAHQVLPQEPSALEERKKEEREFIRDNDTSEAGIWYLIDVNWLTEWKHFVTRGSKPPGPLDNSRLVDVHTLRVKSPPDGKDRWEPVDDYRGVNEEVWNFWVARYGGGPVVRRRELDLYAGDLHFDSARSDPRRLQEAGGSLRQEPPLPGMASPTGSSGLPPRGSASRQPRRREDAWAPSQGAPFQGKEGFDPDAPPGQQGSCRPPIERLASSVRRGVSSMRSPLAHKEVEEDASKNACGLCCDKCDGPHETHACPHFKKAREKHPDAWVAKGTAANRRASSDQEEVKILSNEQARVVSMPGDGSCLFHSLSYGLSDRPSASSLRRDICAYMVKNPDMTIADTAIKDWIKYDSDDTVQAYADRMRGGVWGGGIEMAVLHRMRNVNVHVYERFREGYKRISAFDSAEARQTVSILYQGRNHYDAISIS